LAKLVLRRLLSAAIVLIAVSALLFGLSRMQGDPRLLYLSSAAQITHEQWEEWGRQMGLDKPMVVQYLVWLKETAKGNLGRSLVTNRPVLDAIKERIGATGQLALGAWLFAMLLGFPLGILSAVKRGTVFDYFGRTIALLGQALPPFWVGIMLILTFSVHFHLLPTGRRGGLDHYIMPVVTLGWLPAAGMLRLMRSSMLDVLSSQYVVFARAKGVGRLSIIMKHALKNAFLAPLTYAGLILSGFLAGAVVTETVFAWPGLGRLAIDAVVQNDFPTVIGVVMLGTVFYVFIQLIVDLSYGYVDPRIRY